MDFKQTSAFKIFLKQLSDLIPKIESISNSTIEKEDVRLLLHALKGNAGLFGYSNIGTLAQELSLISKKELPEKIEQVKRSLLDSISEVLKKESSAQEC